MTTPSSEKPGLTELLPCPFCGERSCISISVEHGRPKWFAFCPPCNAHGPWADSESEACSAWNTRTPPATLTEEQREALTIAADCMDLYSPGSAGNAAIAATLRALASRTPPARQEVRPCTCHPDDNPPVPCPRKYALTECRDAASVRSTGEKCVRCGGSRVILYHADGGTNPPATAEPCPSCTAPPGGV